jgi:hypothetical protein
MTMLQRKSRRNRHIAVDILDLVGGGLISAGFGQHSWHIGVLGTIFVAAGLWLDRRNAIDEG